MSGNGSDNAHNNQYGGGSRGPTGGVSGGPGSLGNGGNVGGNWAWKYDPGPKSPIKYDPDGSPRIEITGGWSRVPFVGDGNGGGDTNAPTGGGGNQTGNPSQQPAFGPDGKFNAYVDGYAYQVSLDKDGRTSRVTQMDQPPVTDAEALKLFREGKYFKTREEMLPDLQEERNKGEALRKDKAKQQTEQAWRSLPENSRSFDIDIDGYRYQVNVDTLGKTASIQRTRQPAPTQDERRELFRLGHHNPSDEDALKLLQPERDKGEGGRQDRARQQAEQQWHNLPGNIRNFDVSVEGYNYKVNLSDMGDVKSVVRTGQPAPSKDERLRLFRQGRYNPSPEEALNLLQPERNKGEPGREEQARQQAVAQFNRSPVNQARIQRAEELRRQAEEIRKQQEAENQRQAEEKNRAEEQRKQLEAVRQTAEDRLRSTAVMAVRGFPATDAVSLAPVRYSVAGVGSITLDEPMANQSRDAINKALSELGRLLTINKGGAIGLGIGLLFHSETAGEGSDNIPGRTADNIFSATMPADTLTLPSEGTLRNAANTGKTVNLPVRGVLRLQDGAIMTQLVRTPAPTPVRVVNAILDAATGYYGFTTPEEAGVPSRTILVSPAAAPGAEGQTILTGPVPLPEVVAHTGGPVQTVNSPTATTFPKPEEVIRDTIIVFPPESGLKPIYAMFNKPYGESNAKGEYSGRDYHTHKAGGPIQNLDWKGASIDRAGVDKVKLHTGRFGDLPDNKVMIDRLEKILEGELQVSDTDKRFYTHEIRELERYRALGVPDGVSDDSVWNSAHTATLEDYKINEKNQSLYTPEALEAYRKAEEEGK